jgi:DNA-binding NtrC family response regulator
MLAWKHYAENIDKYVLIIFDLRIDKRDGFELLKKVKDVNPYVRTILIGDHEAKNYGDYQKYMREEIINKFIQKPIGITELYYEADTQLHAYAMNMI